MRSNDIKSIYIDEEKDLVYVGTHTGGLSIIHRASGKLTTIYNEKLKNCYTLKQMANGAFLISGINNRYHFHTSTQLIHLIQEFSGSINRFNRVTDIQTDSKRRLWLVSDVGLSTYIEEGEQLTPCTVLPAQSTLNHQFVNCLYESKDGTFWVGTRKGLYRFDEKRQDIKRYTTAHGLSNNVVCSIREDAAGRLWIGTDRGLCTFYPQSEQIRQYSNDELQNSQFTPNVSCQTPDGTMYFGGMDGLVIFNPNRLADNPYIPSVVINRLELFNKPVLPGDDTDILTQSISETQSITLDARQTSFSISFVVSNYVAGDHNTFAYKLDGYDKDQRDDLKLCLGNLAMLPAKLNTSISNASWQTKKSGKGKSQGLLFYAADIVTMSDTLSLIAWNEKTIQIRAKWLAEKAIEIWPSYLPEDEEDAADAEDFTFINKVKRNCENHDYTKFSLNGKPATTKNQFVLDVVRAYIEKHPSVTYTELLKVFHEGLCSRGHKHKGLLLSVDAHSKWDNKYKDRRYSVKMNGGKLVSGDGVGFYVNTQWEIAYMHGIIKLAKDEGFTVNAEK